MSILIRYGVNNQVSKETSEFPTVGAILSHAGLQQFLGFGSNVEARVGNMTVDTGYVLRDDDIVDLVSRANTKGQKACKGR